VDLKEQGLVRHIGMSNFDTITRARHTHTASTPMPYPTAPVMPQTNPRIRPVRGSNEGESDRHTKTNAPTRPARHDDRRSRHNWSGASEGPDEPTSPAHVRSV
jgi:hypothetical protein